MVSIRPKLGEDIRAEVVEMLLFIVVDQLDEGEGEGESEVRERD